MKFVFSILFMSGLFLVAPSWGQGPCIEFITTTSDRGLECVRRTQTCRAPRGGEDRAVRCECSKLLGESGKGNLRSLSQEDQSAIRNFYDKVRRGEIRADLSEYFSFMNSSRDLGIGVAKSEHRAREDALNTCDSVASNIIAPLLKKLIKEGGGSSLDAEAFGRMFTHGDFEEEKVASACSEAYVCDAGRRLEPPRRIEAPDRRRGGNSDYSDYSDYE